MNRSPKIAVIGAGISGLTAAYLLKKKGFSVKLFERNSRPGGNIRSEKINGFLIEHGPNSTLETSLVLNELFEDLGITSRRIYANSSAAKRYILKNGKLRLLPTNPLSFIKTNLFSAKAKLRLLREPFIKSKSSPSETIGEFTVRRLGREFLDYAIDPFVSGVFAGDPFNINVKTAFPKLYELEMDHGSLIKGAIASHKARKKNKEKSKQSAKTFSFRNGMQELVDALYLNLKDDILKETEVTGISSASDGNYQLSTVKNQPETNNQQPETFDSIVLSLPAYAASNLLRNINEGLAKELKDIYYPPVTVVTAGFRNESLGIIPDGFGFLVPGKENRKILGSLWNSAIFPDRAPEDCSLLTTFVGGSRQPALASLPDNALTDIVMSELNSVMGLRGQPEFVKIVRWQKAIPQYTRNYSELYGKIDRFHSENTGISICSNFYGGISVCDCIKNAYSTVERIEKNLLEQGTAAPCPEDAAVMSA